MEEVKRNVGIIFSFVRTIFANDINIKKELTEAYEDTVIKRIGALPKKYMDKINKIFIIIIALIESINFETFAENLGTISFKIDSVAIFQEYIINNMDMEFKMNAAKKLLSDLRILLICLDKVVADPRKYAAGVAAIQKYKNDIL